MNLFMSLYLLPTYSTSFDTPIKKTSGRKSLGIRKIPVNTVFGQPASSSPNHFVLDRSDKPQLQLTQVLQVTGKVF